MASDEGCKPYCSKSEWNDLQRKYLFADISLGVAVVSLGAAGYLFISTPTPNGSPAARSKRPTMIALAGAF